MSHFSQTALALSGITDTGLFENLATAVLRQARPELYTNLTHPGVNDEGKTVKSPVDGFSFVEGSNAMHMVAAHHTTTSQAGLRAKWFFDPDASSTATGNKPGAGPGDVVKTLHIVKAERETTPGLRVTLALTTNQEPHVDVTREVAAFARRHDIEIDIWSRSRIADFLDNTADGQWLRRKYLNIDQERLSFELLRQLSRRSLDDHRPPAAQNTLIERDTAHNAINELPRPIGFLVGKSGYGKSVAAYQALQAHVGNGGCGFILTNEVLASSINLDEAIDAELRRLHPALSAASGATARSLCSPDEPLLIIVEDINRSNQSIALIERLATWAGRETQDNQTAQPSWRIVCPVWPQFFNALVDEARKRAVALGVELGPYTPDEARAAIQRRASLEGVSILPLEADENAQALANDPLLIALHDLKAGQPTAQVITGFIAERAQKLANGEGRFIGSEYEASLRKLARSMIENRSIAPVWGDVLTWYSHDSHQLDMLRDLTKQAEIIRIAGTGSEARISYRHDRVQKETLIAAVIEALETDTLSDEEFSDPFFAEIVGIALAREFATMQNISRAKMTNPLALFYALRHFREPTIPAHDAIISAIHEWLADESTHNRAHQTLRYSALHVLSDSHSSSVVPIVRQFRDRSWTARLASLRNGDLTGGIKLCHALEPGGGAPWRDRCIDHAKELYGERLLTELDALLRQEHLSESDRVGALRLAGHFADMKLADSIWAAWQSDAGRKERLDEYLWAMAQCGGERTIELLSPVCDLWATLPDEPEKQGSLSPRYEVGNSWLRWAFNRTINRNALVYFTHRADTESNLRFAILNMLQGVDHPDAVDFMVRQFAKDLREIEGTDKFWAFPSHVVRDWERRQRERQRPMSQGSRKRLQTLWQQDSEDKHTRVQAFRIWAATSQPEDIALIREVDPNSVIGDDALRARLKRGDKTAVGAFLEKIRADERGHWWQHARHFWSEELTAELDAELTRRGANVTQTWGSHYRSDWITDDLITRLSPSDAEKILLKHWKHLRFSSGFIQAALYTATPRLLEAANHALSECPDKREMLKYMTRSFGIKMEGHPGVTRLAQVEAIVPYLDDLDAMAISDFWNLCNERGWTSFRKAHLDARLTDHWRNRSGLDDTLIMDELHQELKHDREPWMDVWVDDQLKNGVDRGRLLQVVGAWLKCNQTPRALEVAASIVIHAGTRHDADVLVAGDDGSELASQIIADTRYAIMRRSLH